MEDLYFKENDEINEKIKKKLISKLEQELKDYKQYLMGLPPEQIIDNAYDLVCKQEIIDCILLDGNYSNFELKTLLKRENLLDELYNDWLHADGNLRETLEYCVEDSIETIRDNEVKKQRNRDAR